MLRAAVQVVASVALGALLLALLAGALPSFFGLDAFVLGHDVSSALRAGDLVVASPAHPGQLSVGDVVSYRTPDRPDVLVTRRLVGIAADERGQVTLQTGDRQTGQLDEVAVEPGAVVARLVYAVPWIGFVVDLAKRPEGKVVLIVLPGVLLAVDALLRARAQRHGSVAVSEAEPAAVPGPAPLAPETFDPGVAPADRTAADLLLRQAWVLVRRSATAEATPLLDRALALDPYCASAWLLKAECLTDPWDRRACLQAGLTIDPGAAELRQALEEAPRWDLAS